MSALSEAPGPVLRRKAGRQLLTPTVVSGISLVILFLVWGYYQAGGLTVNTFNDYCVLTTALALAAFGTTVVLLTGGFDLSVAGVVSLVNVLVATQMGGGGTRAVLIVVAALLIGLAAGALNGFTVSVLGLESIATTLAMYIVLGGVALVLLSAPGGEVPAGFSDALTVTVGGMPVALFILLSLCAIWLGIVRTRFGVALFAIGQDEAAAKMSGIHTRRVKVAAYALAGFMYALAGLYYSAETGTGDPNSGTPFLITTFAAVALGGASFAGGRASAIGTVVGAGVLTLIPKLLFALGASDYWSGLIQGIVIILAVLFGIASARMADRRLAAER